MTVTYDSLLNGTPVILNAQNRTLPDAMPAIIRRAEDEILERLDRDALRVTLGTNYVVQPGASTFDLTDEPQRVLEVRAVTATVGGQFITLTPRNVEYLRQLFAGMQGTPRHYAEDDSPSVYRVFPEPDEAVTLRVTANVEPLRLAPSNQTTLLTVNHPRLVEMAVFKQAAIFMRNPTDESRYGGLFEAALSAENARFERRRGDTTKTPTANLTS